MSFPRSPVTAAASSPSGTTSTTTGSLSEAQSASASSMKAESRSAASSSATPASSLVSSAKVAPSPADTSSTPVNVSSVPQPSNSPTVSPPTKLTANGGLAQAAPTETSSLSGAGDPPSTISSNIVHVPASTVFSTTIKAPDSTFSSPVALTVTGQNGQKSLSTPALITSVAPSTATDGTVVEVTQVIANPNNNGNLNTFGRHSFFDNHGAVIGTFIAAGIVAAAFLSIAVCLARRHRRRARRHRLEAVLPTNPFSNTTEDQSAMSQRLSTHHEFGGNYREGSPTIRLPDTARVYSDVGTSSHGAAHAYEGPFSDYHSPRRDSFRGEADVPLDNRPHSRQLSTPSIYPSSVSDDDEDSLYRKEMETRASLPPARHTPSLEHANLHRTSERPSTQETQLEELNREHPPLKPELSVTRTVSPMSQGYTSSSQDHDTIVGLSTPTSDNGTLAASEESFKGHPMLPSPSSAFLRRQLSKRTPLDTAVLSPTRLSSTDASMAPGTAL
ncbi:hypothetical protein K488DRAFT_70402 [Vararia minispora EC-137]|uniref:Uncharacterized protein n=1 Tax=Vararia minispora EC-137 TaxID=1314806 RepID=A0ACB8QLN7_9AGAM|nr:hypothetical protein K488DRAFT_70402 [Vararia minispora EC-137]